MNKTFELYNKYVLKTYKRTPIIFVKGKGSYIWDDEGCKFLDFFPGWGVSGIGHCHPAVVSAVSKQAAKLMHVSNNYYNELQGKLAQLVSESSFKGKVFFCNSGAEANEAAIKLARKYGSTNGRTEIVTMLKSFHGRTLGAMTATAQEHFHQGFKPLVPGFKYIKLGDLAELKKAINKKTVAVMLEPIQGEGGINYAGIEYYKAVRKLCDKHDLLLIFDEVQTGMGRTGKMFCYQHFGVVPDIMTVAKLLGGGAAIGAMVVQNEFAPVLGPGTHASTFGGNPLACAAAIAVFETIKKKKLLSNTNSMGKYLCKKLNKLIPRYHIIKEVRGLGLMIGLELNGDGNEIANVCAERGLLINCTNRTVLRFMPSMTVTKKEIDKAINIFEGVLRVLE